MSEHENEIDRIEPVDFDASDSPLFATKSSESKNNKPSPRVWLAVAGLFVVALAVIFVLPTIVEEYERRTEIEQAANAPQLAPQPAINAISPFLEAQRAEQRKEAQDVLAELLRIQAELDARGVESWAGDAYQEALEFARLGDEFYLQQDFETARDNYAEGSQALLTISEQVPVQLSQHLVAGEAALQSNDSTLAREKFSIALQLDPLSSEAQIGLDRAETLDEVNAKLAEAEQLIEDGDLDEARQLYLAALELDERNAGARQLLEDVEQQILQREFAGVMSEGYGFLQSGDPERAIATFQQAASLGINQQEAEAAIQQTRDDVARVAIDRLTAEADLARSNEEWGNAVQFYDEILAIDANLIFAQEGKDYTSKRLQLDNLLEYSVANPERFADDAVYQQTLDIYYTGRSIEGPGPRLSGQLDTLYPLLESSQVPLDIQFVSNNATQVTLLRIAEMGMFEAQSLSLKPGRYVAVGIREGYRDVRKEFVVGFGQTPDAVVVQCDERIVASRGS